MTTNITLEDIILQKMRDDRKQKEQLARKATILSKTIALSIDDYQDESKDELLKTTKTTKTVVGLKASCQDEDCAAYDLIARNDLYESRIKQYRFHVANKYHEDKNKEFEKDFGPQHKLRCDDKNCPYLKCSQDGDKNTLQILEHLWVYRHVKRQQKSKSKAERHE